MSFQDCLQSTKHLLVFHSGISGSLKYLLSMFPIAFRQTGLERFQPRIFLLGICFDALPSQLTNRPGPDRSSFWNGIDQSIIVEIYILLIRNDNFLSDQIFEMRKYDIPLRLSRWTWSNINLECLETCLAIFVRWKNFSVTWERYLVVIFHHLHITYL